MLTLALETATVPGSLAIANDRRVLREYSFKKSERTAQWLAPTIRRLFADQQLDLEQIGLVALPIGPGSFTGLRIGVTTAKMLAYALQCPVIALNTLDVIASQAADVDAKRLDVVMNAQRKQLFVRSYERTGGLWHAESPVVIRDVPEWVETLHSGVAVSGPELSRLDHQLLVDATMVDSEYWMPLAKNVAALGQQRFELGEANDIWSLLPEYFRKSYAE